MISVHNLSKSYGKHKALEQVSLQLDHKVYGLLGPNGSGKTTFIRCLARVLAPNTGEISVPDRIGYLPQKFGMYKSMRVNEVLHYFAALKKTPLKHAQEAIPELLERVHLSDRTQDKVGSLSGGMLRRLGIAQALLGDPELILVDEPTAGLDPEERLNFKELISEIKKDRTVIISTHIVEDVQALCDQIIIMHKGEILANDAQKAITEYAKGKVFNIPEEMEPDLAAPYRMVRSSVQDDTRYLRVLADAGPFGYETAPTIEDGYLLYVWQHE